VTAAQGFDAADGFHACGKPELPVCVQEIDAPDLFEIEAYGVFTQLNHEGGMIQQVKRLITRQVLEVVHLQGEHLVIRLIRDIRELNVCQEQLIQLVDRLVFQIVELVFREILLLFRGRGCGFAGFGLCRHRVSQY